MRSTNEAILVFSLLPVLIGMLQFGHSSPIGWWNSRKTWLL